MGMDHIIVRQSVYQDPASRERGDELQLKPYYIFRTVP